MTRLKPPAPAATAAVIAYIEAAVEPARTRLRTLRSVIREEAPGAAERMAAELNGGSRASAGKEAPKKGQNPAKDIEMRSLEQRFIDALGTKVSVKGSLDRGTIEISFFSRDDLDRIYELFSSVGR